MKSSALIVLMLPSGEYILQRRTDDAPSGAGMLGLFGGCVEARESPDEGIIRELGEETSLDVDKLTIGFLKRYEQPEGNTYVYLAVVPSATFKVYEGKWAEVHTLEALRMRNDLTPTLHLVVHCLDIAP